MTNIVVTSTTNSIKVVFNDYATIVGMKKGTWLKSRIMKIELSPNESVVAVQTINDPRWTLSYNSVNGAMIIDSIDGFAPTSNSDLYDKLVALLG